jgi:hypothetical protein
MPIQLITVSKHLPPAATQMLIDAGLYSKTCGQCKNSRCSACDHEAEINSGIHKVREKWPEYFRADVHHEVVVLDTA